MKSKNKTRFAILGMLIEEPRTGYEIKSLMSRSTVYFWRESDSTIYPMLKVLAKEGKVLSKEVYVGKKKKQEFSITDTGRAEFRLWLEGSTASETPRNEFLLKLFFITDQEDMVRLFRERLALAEKTFEEYKDTKGRLENLEKSSRQMIRLKSLKFGMAQLKLEINWLKKEIRTCLNLHTL
ncbi:MAG: hypothetical protein SP1CHLAM54_03770 [Chlamydiia bacterium]|nr:hypothetical protein [Chlamydiia bacterium]MCH9615293.1 hypothetical protein [Chlamydiia bacterium]MCH9628385.1 hypothetical protein [Chlamydiia bacterium]